MKIIITINETEKGVNDNFLSVLSGLKAVFGLAQAYPEAFEKAGGQITELRPKYPWSGGDGKIPEPVGTLQVIPEVKP